MNPLNVFILISQLSLGLYVAASPSVAKRAAEKLCDTSQTYAGKQFNLYTSQEDGEKIMISKRDGKLLVGGKDGYAFTGTFIDKPTGSNTYPWYGNLKVEDAEGIESQNAYLSPRSRPLISGGGYTFRVKVPPTSQPPETEWERDVTFGFDCNNGSPTLVVRNLDKGSKATGCGAKGGGLNVVYGVKTEFVYRHCHHKVPPLWIAFTS